MPYRYICDVLDEMRKMHETRNYSGFLGSVEEVQGMANRMESKLREYKSGKISDDTLAVVNKQLEERNAALTKLNKDLDNKRKDLKRMDDDLKALRHVWARETKGGTVLAASCCERHADNMACGCAKVSSEFQATADLEVKHGL